jgi:hypothetical protein
VLTTLEVTPPVADLCAQGNTLQLGIAAQDQNGRAIFVGAGTTTYASSAPEIAGVNASGVVAAAAAGTAVITATFTLGGETRSDSMAVTVLRAPEEYPDIAGVYDVSGLITQSGWGSDDMRETAVMTIEHSRDTPVFTGTFVFFPYDLESSTDGPYSGIVSGSVDCLGGVAFELRGAWLQSPLWQAQGTLAPPLITGTFWDPGSNSGTFTAELRQTE